MHTFLKTCKSMNQLIQIHSQIFILGLSQNIDAIKKLLAFAANPSPGNLHYAQRVFERLETRSLFAYNVMIKAYTKNGDFKKSACLFDEMRSVDGLWPDNYTYPFVFKAIGCLRDGWVSEKVHGFVVKGGDEFYCYVCNSVIDMYGEMGRCEDVRKVFDEMPERDFVSWNVMTAGYVKCKKFDDAVGVYLEMRGDGSVRPDRVAEEWIPVAEVTGLVVSDSLRDNDSIIKRMAWIHFGQLHI